MGADKDFQRRSIEQREEFWAEQAQLVDWHQPFGEVVDYNRPPFAKWFVGGLTNLCYNAVDRHLAERGNQAALIHDFRYRPCSGAFLHCFEDPSALDRIRAVLAEVSN